MSEYTLFLDLAKEVQPPDKGILSRTLSSDGRLKAVLFGFARGGGLSEHTASMPAALHFLQGQAKLTVSDDRHEAAARGQSSLVRLRSDPLGQLKGSWQGRRRRRR